MEFERIVVFGDFHGDLDTMLASLSDKGLVRYDSSELEGIIEQIKAGLNESFVPSLEALVIPAAQPIRVVFLGDFLDRYHFGYHMIQFLDKIRWENFGIYPIFLISNHDLLNFHFFINPFEMQELYQGCGHSRSDTLSYVNGMGIDKSLESFKALHRDEIVNRQLRFYETGTLDYQEACYTLRYQYPCDLSALAQFRRCDNYTAYYKKLVAELGLDLEKRLETETIKWPGELARYLFNLLGEMTAEKELRNWWDISHLHNDWGEHCNWKLFDVSLFINKVAEDNMEILPIDWRVISLVWRHHYGNFFRRLRLFHSEGATLFVHGGISPLAMVDPLAFGNIYDPRQETNTFKPLRSEFQYDFSLEKLLNRSNRLVAQMLENALNDYSFRQMNGTEVVDQMGYWRGMAKGYPTFGGPIWSDFEYLQQNVAQHERLRTLYRTFKEATGIERIICGHSYFQRSDKPELRFLMISELQEVGLDYLCVDNACSRGYRHEQPVLNGIEIDREGKIPDIGEVCTSRW